MCINGVTELPPSSLCKPRSIARREMESYALIPSMVVTVASAVPRGGGDRAERRGGTV